MPGRERGGKKKARGAPSHNPLAEDVEATKFVMENKPQKKVARPGIVVAPSSFAVADSSTRRLLKTRRQQQRLEEGEETSDMDELPKEDNSDQSPHNDFEHDDDAALPEEEDDLASEPVDLEYDDNESHATEVQQFDDLGEQYEIDDAEERILQQFEPSGQKTRNLADIIMAKIQEKQQRDEGIVPEADEELGSSAGSDIDKRVRKVYTAVGGVLRHYTSGKIPKAFKALPHIRNWEQLLMLTKPAEWSPHATYSATRIFANSREHTAQRFYSAILLPIVHEHIAENRKLHPALYMAIRKSLFKPIAFYKGFLLPLCNEGECTLREALIVASILQKAHLPPVPTAVVIVKVSQLPFCSANSVFLRVLIDKKMDLPYQCIDALVKYFHRFLHSHPDPIHEPTHNLPVLWHQTLLSFLQRYKSDVEQSQVMLLDQLCVRHFHRLITPEVRRELAAAQGKLSSMH